MYVSFDITIDARARETERQRERRGYIHIKSTRTRILEFFVCFFVHGSAAVGRVTFCPLIVCRDAGWTVAGSCSGRHVAVV